VKALRKVEKKAAADKSGLEAQTGKLRLEVEAARAEVKP
jgi:hypothetical protein